MNKYFALFSLFIFTLILVGSVLGRPAELSRSKRQSDQRIAELETLLAIERLRGMKNANYPAYGLVDFKKIGRRSVIAPVAPVFMHRRGGVGVEEERKGGGGGEEEGEERKEAIEDSPGYRFYEAAERLSKKESSIPQIHPHPQIQVQSQHQPQQIYIDPHNNRDFYLGSRIDEK